MRLLLAFAFCLVAAALVSAAQDADAPAHLSKQHALTLVLTPGHQPRCVFTTAAGADDRMFFSYRVRNGRNDFDIAVRHPDESVVFLSEANEHDDSNQVYFIAKMAGDYRICFTNPRGESVVTVMAGAASKKVATRKRDAVVKTIAMTEATLTALLEDQEVLRARERGHRDSMESHNTQLIIRFVVEVAVMLAMSVGQVYFLRRLFQRKQARSI
jgi:hypothetical protein